MTNKEAVERLNELLLCTSLLSDNDHESMRAGIKALEVVEEIKKAFIESDTQYDKADILDCNADKTYNILCTAYGTEEDRESWLREYKHDL